MSFQDNWGICEECGKETNVYPHKGGWWCKISIIEDEDKEKSAHHRQEIEDIQRIVRASRGD